MIAHRTIGVLFALLLTALLAGCSALVLNVGGDDDDDTDDDDTGDDDTDDDDIGDDDIEGPAILLDPGYWAFEDEVVGCEQQVEIHIRSVGSEDLVVSELLFTPSSEDLHHDAPFSEATIPPGEEQTMTVVYTPLDDSPDTATLTVVSNDPETAESRVVFNGSAHYGQQHTEQFLVEGSGWTDILWVIDNSTSMGPIQQALAENIPSFVGELDQLDVQYQMAVVTTDDAEFRGPVPIMSPETPDLPAAFAAAASVGTTGSGTEQGFQRGTEAVTPPLAAPGGANDGFLRTPAGLRVIFVSDEDDQSDNPVTNYVATFQSVKASPDHVVLCAITCLPTPRYEDAVVMTSGAAIDLCEPDWAEYLPDLAQLAMTWHDTFPLNTEPLPESIQVHIDGVPAYVGWSYEAGVNAILFEPDYLPDDGDVIDVYYHVPESC